MVYKMMDDMYLLQKFHMLKEVVENYYEMSSIGQSESFRMLVTRADGVRRKMCEITGSPSPDGRGWRLIRKFIRLSKSQIADVMGQAHGEYKYSEVANATKAVFPISMKETKVEKSGRWTGGREQQALGTEVRECREEGNDDGS